MCLCLHKSTLNGHKEGIQHFLTRMEGAGGDEGAGLLCGISKQPWV